MKILLNSTADLPAAATQLLTFANDRKKMAFYGDIGAGKTTFIQAICRQLGVQEPVVSPTFSLINEYTYQDEFNQTQLIYHLDLYRLKNTQEALDIGIEELLYNNYYTFIEWPDLIEDLLPEDVVRIKIEALDHSTRKMLIL